MPPPLAYSVCVGTLLELASADAQARVHVHFADEEGDPYAVALAGRLGAYVAGRDSDFVVLNAEGYQGYVPLDEMVWMSASATAPWDRDVDGSVSVSGETEDGDMDEDGFQTVKKGKGRKKRRGVEPPGQPTVAGRGILPPSALSNADPGQPDEQPLALSFAVYTPSALAAHLDIPVSLLPLLGALLGNDFTGAPLADEHGPPPVTTAEIRSRGRAQNLQRLFFDRRLTLAQRIARVASTLAGILAAAFGAGAGAGQKRRGRKQIASVMGLIDAAVTALLVRPLDSFATGEREAVVERIAEATLQYAVPKVDEVDEEVTPEPKGLHWASDVCPLHVPEACPLFKSLSRAASDHSARLNDREGDDQGHVSGGPFSVVREQYVAAYRAGHLDPHILDCVQTGTAWPRMFLEDPDKECVARSVGRPIRMWTYAILDAGVGLPGPVEPDHSDRGTDESGDDNDDDDDELIDVVESDDDEKDASGNRDLLARLRGALRELDDPDAAPLPIDNGVAPELELHSAAASVSAPSTPLKTVTEYVRRGTRLVPEVVTIQPLADLLADLSPGLSDIDTTLPPQLWPDTARRTLLLRALGSDCARVARISDENLLAVLVVRWVVRRMDERARESAGTKERMAERWMQAEARAVLACLTADGERGDSEEDVRAGEPVIERHVQLVAQVSAALGAAEQLAQVLLLVPAARAPARRFSGARCHALLSKREALAAGELDEEVWGACVDGIEAAYAVPPQKRAKERKVQNVKASHVTSTGKSMKVQRGSKQGGMYGLLADVEV